MSDLISRQSAIDALWKLDVEMRPSVIDVIIEMLKQLPSVEPTLYGYNVNHLIMIAEVLRKENMPPEKVVEVLTDIGMIVAIVRDEFEKSLREVVEQCMI